jgi:hypothetical protein
VPGRRLLPLLVDVVVVDVLVVVLAGVVPVVLEMFFDFPCVDSSCAEFACNDVVCVVSAEVDFV